MVRSRGDSPTEGGANLMPASVPDIARSLRLARLRAELTVREAAARAGLDASVIEALESGDRGQHHDRIATLRSLRAYADALGLPGDDYVLAAVEQWPSSAGPMLITGSETAVVPVVSISSAPAGGHSPAGGHGSVWPGEATGVPGAGAGAGAATTGVMETLRPTSALDTGRVPVVDTGQVPAVHFGVPRLLTFMTVFVAFLVLLGGAALIEHNHLNGWFDSGRSTTTRWVDDAKSALGITSNPSTHGHDANASTTPTTAGKATHPSAVTMSAGAGALSENISVADKSFTVKVLAVTRPCWVDVTLPGQLTPLFEGDLQPGQSHSFVVTDSLSVETGSAAGGTQFYEGFKLLGYYFPPKAPFTINFTAAG
jgi:transcriptional regulator with XRE-family HTH domain